MCRKPKDIMWINSDGLLYNKLLSKLKIKHFVTTKLVGDMKDKTRRDNLLKSLNIKPSTLVTCQQVHSNKVYFVTSKDRGKNIYGVDGLVTETLQTTLGIFAADCVPLFIVENPSESNQLKVALLHIGWRGLKSGIIENAMKFFTNPVVCLGPHICKDCYRMDLEKEIVSNMKIKAAHEIPDLIGDGGLSYRVSKIITIDIEKFCTYHNTKLFYSYRRGDKTQRMLSVISI